MKFYEVKDIIREHFSRFNFPTKMLSLSLQYGRQQIEAAGNFWWMKSEKDFNLVVNQATYSITTLDTNSSGLNLPKFKDARALIYKKSTDVRYGQVTLGKSDKEELDLFYDTDDAGPPEEAIINDTSLIIYPPEPDLAYNMRLYFYQWTENPSSNLGEDDLTKFFPMALVYSSLVWGYEMELKDLASSQYYKTLLEGAPEAQAQPAGNAGMKPKDFAAATYWSQKMGGAPFGRGGELNKIRMENFRRDIQDKFDFTPRLGPGGPRRRRLDNVQIYR